MAEMIDCLIKFVPDENKLSSYGSTAVAFDVPSEVNIKRDADGFTRHWLKVEDNNGSPHYLNLAIIRWLRNLGPGAPVKLMLGASPNKFDIVTPNLNSLIQEIKSSRPPSSSPSPKSIAPSSNKNTPSSSPTNSPTSANPPAIVVRPTSQPTLTPTELLVKLIERSEPLAEATKALQDKYQLPADVCVRLVITSFINLTKFHQLIGEPVDANSPAAIEAIIVNYKKVAEQLVEGIKDTSKVMFIARLLNELVTKDATGLVTTQEKLFDVLGEAGISPDDLNYEDRGSWVRFSTATWVYVELVEKLGFDQEQAAGLAAGCFLNQVDK